MTTSGTFRVAGLSLMLILSASQAGAQAPPARQGGGGPPPAPSPEVLPDHRVTFRIQAPKASEVTLRGDWMSGQPAKLEKDDKGLWSVTVGPLTPDYYSYSFTVDGGKTIDPRNATIKQGDSATASMVVVDGDDS